MRFEQLQYLDAAIRTGSFRQAASELDVAQPTVSTQVQRLEEDLGVVLLVRNAQGVRPTYAAEQLLPHVQAALRAERALRQEASAVGGLREGRVRMAAVSAASQAVLPPIVRTLSKEYPGIHIEITEMGSDDVHEGVASGRYDIGMMTRLKSMPTDEMRYVDVAEGRLVLMVPEDNPLARATYISPEDLDGQSVIVFTPASLNSSAFDALTSGVDVHPVCYTDSAETATRMVRAGVGISIANTLAVSTRAGDGIALVPFDDHVSELYLSVVLRPNEQLTPAARVLLGHLRGLAR